MEEGRDGGLMMGMDEGREGVDDGEIVGMEEGRDGG